MIDLVKMAYEAQTRLLSLTCQQMICLECSLEIVLDLQILVCCLFFGHFCNSNLYLGFMYSGQGNVFVYNQHMRPRFSRRARHYHHHRHHHRQVKKLFYSVK